MKYNRSMQLKKIKRTEKKGTESVMDEKFSILFSSKFFIGNELQFEVSFSFIKIKHLVIFKCIFCIKNLAQIGLSMA